MLGGGLEKEAVAVVFIVCALIRESKNNDACDADFGPRPCSFSQARQPWEPLIEWHTRSTASITKPRAGQPFLWIKYVRDDKNLPSMGSGGNKKIHNGVGAGRGEASSGLSSGSVLPSFVCTLHPHPWASGAMPWGVARTAPGPHPGPGSCWGPSSCPAHWVVSPPSALEAVRSGLLLCPAVTWVKAEHRACWLG